MDYAVIMAGGTGKRLWPLSRQSRPKQVLKLIDGQTLLRRCFDRLTPIFDQRNILVLTNAGYADIVRENLPEVPYGNVIAEPAVRDTAGAIGLAATVLTKYDPNAAMAVVTADQLIEPDEVFQKALTDALWFINALHRYRLPHGYQCIWFHAGLYHNLCHNLCFGNDPISTLTPHYNSCWVNL